MVCSQSVIHLAVTVCYPKFMAPKTSKDLYSFDNYPFTD